MSRVCIRDFVIGVTRTGTIMVKRYTWVKSDDCYSDYPLWEFAIETLGM
jgi:hypothetical protein